MWPGCYVIRIFSFWREVHSEQAMVESSAEKRLNNLWTWGAPMRCARRVGSACAGSAGRMTLPRLAGPQRRGTHCVHVQVCPETAPTTRRRRVRRRLAILEVDSRHGQGRHNSTLADFNLRYQRVHPSRPATSPHAESRNSTCRTLSRRSPRRGRSVICPSEEEENVDSGGQSDGPGCGEPAHL